MKLIRRMSCLLAVILLLCTVTPTAAAKKCRFRDVADTHWAAESIEALANGGLVQGYGNNKFGPNDAINVDQIATIICNAKGHSVESEESYWAYEAVRYCRDELKCLPNLGDITAKNYAVNCTRELAISMLTIALGTNNPDAATNWTKEDIPDYDEIDSAYAKTILKAYQLGLIIGTDSEGTFDPDGLFTRAQICAILNRAGYIKAAEKPDDTAATGLSGEEIYAEVKSWGGWREWESVSGSVKKLTATDPIYGGVEVTVNDNGVVTITMSEENQSAWLDKDGDFVDAYGNKLSTAIIQNDFIDENGKYVMSSGWSYEARQLVKKVLALAYPESADEAYQALLDVMGQKIWEIPSQALPSAGRWVDGRSFKVTLDGTAHTLGIVIHPANETSYYDSMMAGASSGVKSNYVTTNCESKYELNRG